MHGRRWMFAAILILTTACTGASAGGPSVQPLPTDPSPSDLPGRHPMLVEGVIEPGRYLVPAPAESWAGCGEWVKRCPAPPPLARSLQVAITIPRGWEAAMESTVIVPEGFDDGSFLGPDGAGLTLGWTGRHPSGLQSDPCQRVAHHHPDILVGPTVEDFVDAAMALASIEVSEAVDVELGGYRGRYFELTVPPDIAGCEYWRAFDPGLQAQGPNNIWSLWVMDVEGYRFTVLTEEFPGTPAKVHDQLRSMVRSIRFVL